MTKLLCRCNCGYSCGGPGTCKEPSMQKCLDEHFVQDCDHVWDGPGVDIEMWGTKGSSTTCSVCGTVAMFHDMNHGP